MRHLATPPKRRPAISLVEVITALAIVAAGLVPLFQVYRGARVHLGISRDMVQLQDEAHRLLEMGRARVRLGRVRPADLAEDLVVAEGRGDIRSTLTLSRFLETRSIMLRARAERGDRFYETYQVVADPYSAFHRDVLEGGGSP